MFTLRISSCGPPGTRTTAEIDIASTSVPLSAILPEAAARCLPEDTSVPPGYELAIWSGASVYGTDSVLFVGTLREVEALRQGELENAPQPAESEPVFCQIFQPNRQDDLPNASILRKGARVFGGHDMGCLVFARRDCTSLSDPGALIFPGRVL
jgi:hypothetical protein